MKKKLSLLLAFVLCLGLVPRAHADNSPFNDVKPVFWAYDAILEAYNDGVMTGTAPGVFSPDGKLDMAQFTTILARGFYKDELTSPGAGDNWWDPAYRIAYYDNHNLFGEVHNIAANTQTTREVMAEMMYRVMVDKGASLPSETDIQAAMNKIPDIAAVSGEFKTAVAVCYHLELLSGVDMYGTFSPKGLLNRGQTAAIYTRLKKAINVSSTGVPSTPGTTNPGTAIPGTTNPGIPQTPTDSNTPSPNIWSGTNGRVYAAQVSNWSDVQREFETAMDIYPTTVVFFSSSDLYNNLDRNVRNLVEKFEITHGLQLRVKEQCYDCNYFIPTNAEGAWYDVHTPGDYYELRINLHYSAAGLVRMYREGIISELPKTQDSLFGDTSTPANYELLLNAAAKIESQYGLTRSSSDYDKAFAIYNWITSNIDYDHYMAAQSGNNLVHMFDSILYPDEINYALTYQKGACFEYALLFQALCYVFDLDCYYVSGESGNAGHAWDIVKIDNQWYQVDATWDEGKTPASYKYFLVSDDVILSSRTVGSSDFYSYPACPNSCR